MPEVAPLDRITRASRCLGAIQSLLGECQDIALSPDDLYFLLAYIANDLRQAEADLLAA